MTDFKTVEQAINNKNPKLLITHTDLDGIGCEILFRTLYKDSKIYVYNTDYNNLSYTINIVQKKHMDADVYITDLSPNKNIIESLQNNNRFILLVDHHATSKELNEYPQVILSTDSCATQSFYNYLCEWVHDNHKVNELKKYTDFVRLVNDYDLWYLKYPESKKLNDLYYLIGKEKFIKRMLTNPSPYPTQTEQELLQVEEEQKQRYLEESLSHYYELSPSSCCIFAERYISELGSYILTNTSYSYVFIINMLNKTVNIRSKKDYDCSVIAQNYGGGGHKNASGYPITEELLHAILNIIFDKGVMRNNN